MDDEQAAREMNLDVEAAEGWKPEPGDLLVGEVTDVTQGFSEYSGEPYPILTVRKQDGEQVAVHGFQFVLKERILAFRPQIGERVGIRYIGKESSKDGRREIAVYHFRVDGRGGRDPYAGMTSPRQSQGPESASAPADDDPMFS